MAWIKGPPEHHPVFRVALPCDPWAETLQMFGGIAAKLNGHLFAGLSGRSAMERLGETDRAAALALDGAALFDPIGRDRARNDKVTLPEDVFHEPDELRQWIARAFEYCVVLPRKNKAAAGKPTARSQEATGQGHCLQNDSGQGTTGQAVHEAQVAGGPVRLALRRSQPTVTAAADAPSELRKRRVRRSDARAWSGP